MILLGLLRAGALSIPWIINQKVGSQMSQVIAVFELGPKIKREGPGELLVDWWKPTATFLSKRDANLFVAALRNEGTWSRIQVRRVR